MSSSVGFKEWEAVCDALRTGRQSILLRKGGIHEGREGFSFKHSSFYLFPTKFHAQLEHIREPAVVSGGEWEVGDELSIELYCQATCAITLRDWSEVEKLFPLHIFSEATLRERFYWEGKGMAKGSIHVALVRTYRLNKPIPMKYEKRHAGCRSWIELPIPPPDLFSGAAPAVSDDRFMALEERFGQLQ